jgi:hypothetical protein
MAIQPAAPGIVHRPEVDDPLSQVSVGSEKNRFLAPRGAEQRLDAGEHHESVPVVSPRKLVDDAERKQPILVLERSPDHENERSCLRLDERAESRRHRFLAEAAFEMVRSRRDDGRLCFVDESFADCFPPGVLGIEHNLVSREERQSGRGRLSEPVIEGVEIPWTAIEDHVLVSDDQPHAGRRDVGKLCLDELVRSMEDMRRRDDRAVGHVAPHGLRKHFHLLSQRWVDDRR